jgi:predicted hotdog family 3-hydroxylacyl-ACP dehydratase
MEHTPCDIITLIPQKPPFVMVDHLVFSDEKSSRSSFLVQADNIFVEEGFLKEPALVENIAQTAAARAGHFAQLDNKPVLVGYIGSVKNLDIHFLPQTGDELITEIVIENQIFNVTLITGKISCNEKPVAQCQMKIFITQP